MRIVITGTKEWSEALQATVLRGVRAGLEQIGERGVGLVVENTPVATGKLAQSVFPALEETGGMLTEVITNGAPEDLYSAPVETGSQPHMPPYEALIPWVIRKLGITDEQTARGIAFVIARKIAQRGTQGAWMYRDAMEVLEREATGILERNIAEACMAEGF